VTGARIGFRGSIALLAAFLSLVTLGIAFTLVSVSVNGSQERQFDDALVGVADAEAADLSLHPEEEVAISDRPGPAANDVGPLPLFGALYDERARVLSRTPTFGDQAPGAELLSRPDRRAFDFTWHEQALRGVFVPLPARKARLLVAAPRSDLDGDAAFLRRALIAIFAVAVAWTAVLAFGIASRITRTHRTIVDTARRVSAGDLSARVGSRGTGEMAALARDVDDMIERLGVLLSSQQQFIAHAAHELRSPLSTLYGELTQAVRRPRENGEYLAAIEQALRSTRKLRDLTEDLLTLARLGAKDPEPRDPLSLRAVLTEVIADLRPASEARHVLIRLSASPDLPVDGRRNDLLRLFRNLVENAIRHSPTGGAIDVRLHADEDDATVEVADHGAGVPEADRARIFAPFFRRPAKVEGSNAGTGLGLAIARDVARLHGGDVTLGPASAGTGATFVVRLPLQGRPPSSDTV
jgi:two-component system heavy metal sensor histidine kinase CusS